MDRRGEAKGYVVVLLGALAFVVGCFLPYYDYPPSGIESVSLYRLYTFGLGAPGISVGGVLVLFAGLATLVWVALAGVRGSGNWTRPTLVAVSIAWSLTWIGTLLNASRFGTPESWATGCWFSASEWS